MTVENIDFSSLKCEETGQMKIKGIEVP